ncbi:hypothetical protein NDU88_008272 [Pleurodeles waltl]|uniref:Uncharacterized protein n=1 Tax=Pleurodeles waltl TaxID=8319 RepID=A0AAV7QN90_PLEWA|nr:hypothetical protein NDU88_008272 [Pleurodeles waltl]
MMAHGFNNLHWRSGNGPTSNHNLDTAEIPKVDAWQTQIQVQIQILLPYTPSRAETQEELQRVVAAVASLSGDGAGPLSSLTDRYAQESDIHRDSCMTRGTTLELPQVILSMTDEII